MLPRDRAEKILTLSQAGWPVRAIADQLGHSPQTIRGYLNGRRTPGVRASRPSLLPGPLADYCRQRFAEDPSLRPSALFKEVADLGFQGSRATFYRELPRRLLIPPGRRQPRTQGDLPQNPPGEVPRFPASKRTPVLPRRVAPITGEALISYLTRLGHANHLTINEILAVLPSWFHTKINNRDDRAQHHMLIPATTQALSALARLTGTAPANLARALPAFGASAAQGPARAAAACHRCTARRGVHQLVPVHLPAHHKICTRHGIWLSDAGQPHLDLAACPEIIAAQHRANRLLRRYTPQQLLLAYQTAANAIPPWPASPAAIPHHWRHRLLILQTANHQYGIPPATTPTPTRRNTPTPSPSPQPGSTRPTPPGRNKWQHHARGPRRANFDGTTPTTPLPLKKARTGQGHQAGPTSLSQDSDHDRDCDEESYQS